MGNYGTASQATDENTVRRMRIACYRHTHSEYVILIAFSQQQWLRKRTTLLRYMYIACLVNKTAGGIC